MEPARKRYRFSSTAGGKKRHAIMIQKSLQARFPRSEFGAQYIRRTSAGGDPSTAATYGDTWGTASEQQRANRTAHGYYGRGKFSFGKSLRALGGYAKSVKRVTDTVGSAGVNIARNIGMARSYMGGGLYGGQGSYDRKNALITGGDLSMTVHGQSDETDSLTLTNREFVKEIYAPNNSGFNLETIAVNPGLYDFAPKLAAIAGNYQQYELKQLVFEIVPLVSESNVNNGITGTIMAVFNYDANTDPFDNKEDIMQASGAVSGRIVDSLKLGVECDNTKTKDVEYFIRTTPVPINRDNDEFDHGKCVIATNNIPSQFYNLTIAELYVYYTVELRHWKPGSIRLNNQQRDEFLCNIDVKETETPSTAIPANESANGDLLRAHQSNIGGKLTGNNDGGASRFIYTFPASVSGFFEIQVFIERSGGSPLTRTAAALTVGVGSQITLVNDMLPAFAGLGGDGVGSQFNCFSADRDIAIYHVKVRSAVGLNNNSAIIAFTGGDGSGDVKQWGFKVFELSQNLWPSRTNTVPVYVNDRTGVQVAV